MVLYAVVLLASLVGAPVAHAVEPVRLQSGERTYDFHGHLEILEDPEARWTVEQVDGPDLSSKFVATPTDTPNFGFTKSAYWIRFEILNPLSKDIRLTLEEGYPALDHIELYFKGPDGRFVRKAMGDTFVDGNKAIDHFNFLFPLELAPGEHRRLYMRVQSKGAIQVPLKLYTLQAFYDFDHRRQLGYGLHFGMLLVMMLYNLFLFIAIRDRSYLLCSVYILGAILYQSAFDGLAQHYLWHWWPWWSNRAIPFSIALTQLGTYLFTRDFLNLRTFHPTGYKVFTVFVGISAASMVLSLMLPYNMIILFVSVMTLVVVFVVCIQAVLSWVKGYRPARWFVVAWAVFLLGILIVALGKFGVLPRTPILESCHEIGSALNVVLLSFALGDRFNAMRREKNRAQAEALAIQQQAAEILEEEVARKTEDLRKRTEELEQAYERLAEHDRLKSRFFSNVSHELRTPLTLILAPLRRILEGDKSAPMEVHLGRVQTMERNTQRLLRLVNQLLDFSRLESGAMKVTYEPYDVRSLIEPIVQAFEPYARSKGLSLELRGREDLPEVYIDSGKLDKVMCNLLSNACKFTNEGGSVIVRLDRDEDWLIISVKDTGIGIASEHLNTIFERFGQVDDGAGRRYEGTGIGLALSKELAELTGGQLTVESEPGFGSKFTVKLPLGTDHIPEASLVSIDSQPELAAVSDTAQAAVAAMAAESRLGKQDQLPETGEITDIDPLAAQGDESKPLLVVVEDNADMRALVSEICQEEFRIVEAADGHQGLEAIQSHQPALVISDVMMPGMDGNELLQRIRQDPKTETIPFMLLTAKAGPELKLDGLERGADDYLSKPFEARELLARARNLIRLQKQERALMQLNAKLQQEVVSQAAELERSRMLTRFLPPAIAREVVDKGEVVQAEQRRSRICVFRVELKGFEDLIEIVEPEELAAMLNVYLSEMTEVIFSHAATIDSISRDTIAGFVGAPTSKGTDQDATTCARMSLELWDRAVKVCQRWMSLLDDQPPMPTMVLAAGTATVGFFGSQHRMDYTAIGGPVDEATELLQKARAGELICTHAVWRLLQETFDGDYTGEVEMRHRVRPIKVYRLAGPPITLTPSRPAISPTASTLSQGVATPSGATYRDVGPGANMDQLERGALLDARFEVVRRLGAGGMGTVYLARDRKLSTDVALKIVRQSVVTDERSRTRLYREVRLARLLSHQNIARIYDLSEWQGIEFFTMEYIDGHTLGHMLRSGKVFSIEEGKDILLQLCEGLTAAHTAKIVHRDLKPSNIMINREGRVVILDFGVARGYAQHQTGTHSDRPVGTPFYMAPEQFTGGTVDHRADIYALGVVAYEMLTGQRPFTADSAISMAYMHAHQPPPDPQLIKADIPPRIAAVILCCLEKSPESRFGSASEISFLLSGSAAERRSQLLDANHPS